MAPSSPSPILFSSLSEVKCSPRPGLEEVVSSRLQTPHAFGPLLAPSLGSEDEDALQISNVQVSSSNHPFQENFKPNAVVRQNSAPCYPQDSAYGTASSSSPSSFSSSPVPLRSKPYQTVIPNLRHGEASQPPARRRIARATTFLPCHAPNCKLAFTNQEALE